MVKVEERFEAILTGWLFLLGELLSTPTVQPLIPSEMKPALNPILVIDQEGLDRVGSFMKRTSTFCLDAEWNVTDDFVERTIRVIQVGDRDEQYIIDLLAFAQTEEALIASQGNYGVASELLLGSVINTLRPYLENHDVTKVGTNLQSDYQVLNWCLGIRSTGFYDCHIAEKNIHAGIVHFMRSGFWAFEDLCRKYIGLELQDKTTGHTFNLSDQLTDTQIQYAALDVRLPIGVRAGQLRILEHDGLLDAAQIDFDSISAFGDMYLAGIGMSDPAWQALIDANVTKKKRIVTKLDTQFIPVTGTKVVSEADLKHLDELEMRWRDSPDKTPEQKQQRKDYRLAFFGFRKHVNDRVKKAGECEGDAAINYGSPKQLLVAMRKMGYGQKKLPDTNDKTLEKLAKLPNLTIEKAFEENNGALDYDIVDLLRLYRTVDKLLDTYGEAWLKDDAHKGHRNNHTNRIHSNINLLGAATGRTSSSDPNIQNLPKENAYRNCFVARPGYKIITVDYSGAELRILAFLSQEPVWLEAFAKGWDVHSVGAEMLYGDRWRNAAEPDCKYYHKDHQKCKCKGHGKLRNHIKSVNFGLAYGLQAKGLADQLGIAVAEAEDLLAKYKAAFPTVMAFLDKLGKDAKTYLQVRTVTGRRRRWIKPTYELAKERLFNDPKRKGPVTEEQIRRRWIGMANSIEREGKNAPIQGANADLTKRAMFLAWLKLFPVYGAFFINMVHDEIVIECPAENADACLKFVSDCMVQAGAEWIKGIVMEVEGGIADYWKK